MDKKENVEQKQKTNQQDPYTNGTSNDPQQQKLENTEGKSYLEVFPID